MCLLVTLNQWKRLNIQCLWRFTTDHGSVLHRQDAHDDQLLLNRDYEFISIYRAAPSHPLLIDHLTFFTEIYSSFQQNLQLSFGQDRNHPARPEPQGTTLNHINSTQRENLHSVRSSAPLLTGWSCRPAWPGLCGGRQAPPLPVWAGLLPAPVPLEDWWGSSHWRSLVRTSKHNNSTTSGGSRATGSCFG